MSITKRGLIVKRRKLKVKRQLALRREKPPAIQPAGGFPVKLLGLTFGLWTLPERRRHSDALQDDNPNNLELSKPEVRSQPPHCD